MQIQTNMSLRKEISQMDRLMRKANIAFPRLSPYKAEMRLNSDKKKNLFGLCVQKLGAIVDENREKCLPFPWSTLQKILTNDLTNVKEYRLGDCGESSSIMLSSLLANGYKDGEVVRLLFKADARDITTGEYIGSRIFDTTHELIVRNLSKNADVENPKTYGKNLIVMDAWAGFCANMQEAFAKYYEIFKDGMRSQAVPNHNAIVKYTPIFQKIMGGEMIRELDTDEFKREFPELIV